MFVKEVLNLFILTFQFPNRNSITTPKPKSKKKEKKKKSILAALCVTLFLFPERKSILEIDTDLSILRHR